MHALLLLGEDALNDTTLIYLNILLFNDTSEIKICDINSFCLRFFSALFQNKFGRQIAIRFFADVPLEEFYKSDVVFPSTITHDIHLAFHFNRNNMQNDYKEAFGKLNHLINMGGNHLQAYSLLPFMIESFEEDKLFPQLPEEQAKTCLSDLRSSGNRLALLGCILHILTGHISEALKEYMWEDLRGLLQEENLLKFWSHVSDCFSLEGCMIIYKALISLSEVQREPLEKTISSYRHSIREKLEALPVDTQKLLELAGEAHRND